MALTTDMHTGAGMYHSAPLAAAATGGVAAGHAGTADRADLRDYLRLLKPRVMSLVVFTGFVGLYLAPGTLHPLLAAVAVLCIAVGAGGAAAINMWYDRDIDAVMSRTRARPLPAGRVLPAEALSFGIVLSAGSVLLMGVGVNWIAAGLLLLTILFYVFIYTIWLKRRTPQNIVIGGAAGAFPPMVGWAAVTGSAGPESLILFAMIFFWTPPHFWALALYRSDDYARAGVPMLPVTAGDRATRRQIMLYALLLLPVTMAPLWTGMAGALYGWSAVLLNGVFLAGALAVLLRGDMRSARGLFGYSILYLFALFAALILDRVGGGIG